ncbi:MAG TPA: 6-pyruvoyl-tetrahydropterin synthase-related protein, partial [Candidatus Eisenbacteria bacterium]|nr:6-pyruvoyl-tetrahydropterin synthase-related protein [Candidatus Eisenbacteria bacterium]
IFFYLWTKRFWGNMGGFVSSLIYTFAPYHFVDIYVRGSVGEVWALGIFPAFLWSYTTYIDTKKPLHLVLASIFLGLTIFSHNILGLMFFAFVASYVALCILMSQQKLFLLLSSFFILLLSLALSSIFWIPALFETHYVTGLQIYTIQRNFPDLFQLLFPSWGTGFFDSNLGDEMSVQIGIANLLACVLAFCTLLFFIKRKKGNMAITLLFFFFWLSVVLFLMLPVSLPVWKSVPLINYFQFPWRLLSLTILICGFFAGSIFSIKNSKILLFILSSVAIATTYSYIHPAYYMMRNDTYYTTRSNFIDSTNSPGNSFNTIWNTAKTTRSDELFVVQNDVTISQITKLSSTKYTADILSFNPHTQIVNISYFPGWSATLDDVPVSIKEHQGLISFPIPKGKRTVVLTLKETPLETFAGYLSVITGGILFSIFLFGRKISTLKV